LFETFESPVAFVLFQSRYPQKLIDGLLRVVDFHLLGIIVFVFDSDVARLVLILVFVFKVVLLIAGILHEIIVVRHGEG
jgi:hypothetical protein